MIEESPGSPLTVTIGSDLTVGAIGYGAMQLTGRKVWGEYPDHDGAIALLREVVAQGVTYIDTADVYGPHANEELIREALHPYPENLVIATKGGFGGMRQDGLIRHIGLSNISVDQLRTALSITDIAAATVQYTVAVRDGAAMRQQLAQRSGTRPGSRAE
jgi:aryl-alcohol dehydrogenase-like predicted oxidoreductase